MWTYNYPNLINNQLIQQVLRNNEMPVVYWIKRSKEKTNKHLRDRHNQHQKIFSGILLGRHYYNWFIILAKLKYYLI